MNCKYDFSQSVVSPYSILKDVSAVHSAVEPKVMFGIVSTDSSNYFYECRRKLGRKVRFCGANKCRTDV